MDTSSLNYATFGGGCFWCTEAVYQRLKGVKSVESGYSGGKNENPTYKQICSGSSGHAEVIQVGFNPLEVKYDDILRVFFSTHDPTTLNRQGNDEGTQYRSVIFYHDQDQKKLAEFVKTEIDASGIYKDPIVTEIVPLTKFYKAEDYHQNYYNDNPYEGYCQYVVRGKVDKFLKLFKDKAQDPI